MPTSTARAETGDRSVATTIVVTSCLDHEGGHHAEHPVSALSVRQDVAVEGPCARVPALDDGSPALTRVDPQGVARERSRPQRVAVTRHDAHRHPVEVP